MKRFLCFCLITACLATPTFCSQEQDQKGCGCGNVKPSQKGCGCGNVKPGQKGCGCGNVKPGQKGCGCGNVKPGQKGCGCGSHSSKDVLLDDDLDNLVDEAIESGAIKKNIEIKIPE